MSFFKEGVNPFAPTEGMSETEKQEMREFGDKLLGDMDRVQYCKSLTLAALAFLMEAAATGRLKGREEFATEICMDIIDYALNEGSRYVASDAAKHFANFLREKPDHPGIKFAVIASLNCLDNATNLKKVADKKVGLISTKIDKLRDPQKTISSEFSQPAGVPDVFLDPTEPKNV
jgi:hypothetical protein